MLLQKMFPASKGTLDIEVTILNESGKTSDVTVSNYLLSGVDTVNKLTDKLKVEASSSKKSIVKWL